MIIEQESMGTIGQVIYGENEDDAEIFKYYFAYSCLVRFCFRRASMQFQQGCTFEGKGLAFAFSGFKFKVHGDDCVGGVH